MKYTKKDLTIGSILINTKGNRCTIVDIINNQVNLISENGISYSHGINTLIDYYINSGKYKVVSLVMNNDTSIINLNDTKIHVKNEEESRLVQEYAFKQGFTWHYGKEVSYTDKQYLFFHIEGKSISYSDLKTTFDSEGHIKITIGQIINITNKKDEQITEIITESRSKKGGTAITSNSPRKIASSSRLVGNAISNSVKTTRIGRFEISRTAISA